MSKLTPRDLGAQVEALILPPLYRPGGLPILPVIHSSGGSRDAPPAPFVAVQSRRVAVRGRLRGVSEDA
jgi:hypothetical protein